MEGNVIKEFLVGLGFELDEKSLSDFNKAITSATLKVAALATGVQVAAGSIFYGISKVSEGFEDLGYEYRIIAPMINKTLQLRQAMLDAFRSAGINITQAVQASVIFNFALAKTKFAFEAIYKSVAIKFLPLLTTQMDSFRKKLYDNLPKIQAQLEKFITFAFRAFDSVVVLGTTLWSVLEKVYDFFVKLHDSTNGWSTAIIAVIAAWRILNLGFLATPFGLLIAGFTALLELWDDLKTFQRGGQALIDWGSDATKVMVGLAAAILAVVVAVKAFTVAQALANAVIALNPFVLLIAGIVALIGLLSVLIFKWENVKKAFSDFFGSIGSKIINFVTDTPNISANVKPENDPLAGLLNPVGSTNVQNSSSQQSINQETNIIIQGSADANSTGKAVAGEQSKVIFDMARNMRGSVR